MKIILRFLPTFKRLILSYLFPFFDLILRKKNDLWVFPVGLVGGRGEWRDNIRFIYDQAVDVPAVTCVILFRIGDVGHPKTNAVRIDSLKGMLFVARAGVIFIHHGSNDYYWKSVSPLRHLVVNLWHGVPLKGIGLCDAANYDPASETAITNEGARYSILICSSHIDRLAMSTAFRIPYQRVLPTGLPRNDALVQPASRLSPIIQDELAILTKLKKGRKLVSYIPTWRESGQGCYQFSHEELAALQQVLAEQDVVFGVKCHPNDTSGTCLSSEDWIIDLNSHATTEMASLLLATDLLVTDFSSVWVDYLLLDRPIVSICYDYADYMRERGLIYDYPEVFPGRINMEFPEFLANLQDNLANGISESQKTKNSFIKRMYHLHDDGQNSRRVVETILRTGPQGLDP